MHTQRIFLRIVDGYRSLGSESHSRLLIITEIVAVKAAGEGTAMADAIAATAGTNAEMYSIADGIANKLFVAYAAYTK